MPLSAVHMLGEKGLPFALIFTKADKQSPVKTDQNVAKFRKALLTSFEEVPDIFITSSESALGKDEVLNFIDGINREFVVPDYKSFE
jgi:GTP-binding protein